VFKNKHGGDSMNKATQATASVNPAYLRRPDAAAYLNVSERTISDWQRKRIIPHVKAGKKCVLFKRSDLDAAMNRFTVQAVGC
jgi:excisionase family DNA binding protein